MTSVRSERKSSWGWVHVVSLLVAVALHGLALYAVAHLFSAPLPQPKPLTVLMQEPASVPAAASPPPGSQQAAALPSRPAKRLHKATLPSSGHKIFSSDRPASPVTSMADAPVPVMPTASETQASASSPSSPGVATGVAVGSDLAFFCPVRSAPVYPQISRKMGEEGTVLLRVEWDQEGRITSSRVQQSSGFRRLDEAALDALNRWRCNPAKQDGLPVRATAVQAFSFALEDE